MGAPASFGRIAFELAGGLASDPVGGRVKGYAWWQARGFSAAFELLDEGGAPAHVSGGRLVFLVRRLQMALLHVHGYAPGLDGIEAAKAPVEDARDADRRADRWLYDLELDDLRLDDAPGALAWTVHGGTVTVSTDDPIVWFPVGTQTFCRFAVWAWFVPPEGRPVVFARRDEVVYWADAPAPVPPGRG